jgi:hypothetical protein
MGEAVSNIPDKPNFYSMLHTSQTRKQIWGTVRGAWLASSQVQLDRLRSVQLMV